MKSIENFYHDRTQQRLAVHAERFRVDVSDLSAEFPKEFESVFRNANLVVLGAGDWVFGWSSVDKRLDFLTDATGTTRYVYAPDLVRQDGSENKEALGELCRRYKLDPSVFGTIMRAPDDVPEHAISFIFSPNRYHDDHLEELLKNPHIEAVYVEKPMAMDGQELQRVHNIVESTTKKIYFGDHYLFAGIGLFALMGKHIPYQNLLVTTSSELRKVVETAKPLLGNIVKIEARNVFIGHENVIERRSWLEKRSQGGGVLLDLRCIYPTCFMPWALRLRG